MPFMEALPCVRLVTQGPAWSSRAVPRGRPPSLPPPAPEAGVQPFLQALLSRILAF